MADNYTFFKTGTLYIPYKNNEQISGHGISIVYNWFTHKNCYKVDQKVFTYLKDAKQYIRDNY